MSKLTDFRRMIAHNVCDATERQQFAYNLRHRPREFEVDQLVMAPQRVLSSAAQNYSAKLAGAFTGPYRITRKLSPNVYEIAHITTNHVIKVSGSDLKPYHE